MKLRFKKKTHLLMRTETINYKFNYKVEAIEVDTNPINAINITNLGYYSTILISHENNVGFANARINKFLFYVPNELFEIIGD